MTATTAPAPQVWPTLRAADTPALIRFLVEACGFEEVAVFADGDVVQHARLAWPECGGIMLGSVREADDAWPLQPGSCGSYVVCADPDAVFARAVAAGATVVRGPADACHGRECTLRDPEGNRWSFGTYRGEPR
ncbi:Uncharacterized conserved protein PhnB, glyoxalase superfamily [Klenkia marina]|uniref:Uncharacterized conserved protein PhnB, glyoxalase superfamily n=1 Tax=Klenkia marina TaxID=1960309 RepID=A0A1G4Y850_9ACTN|nr:Uncharacterized conserved protein PhnB, glyoxalase superfamily [Klenkia marina]